MSSLNFLKIDEAVIGLVILMLLFLLIHKYLKAESTEVNQTRKLGIDELIEQVKTDLETIDEKRIKENKASLFRIDSFDLEINFVVKKTTSNEAAVTYEVVTVGGKTETSAEKVQKITLHWKATDYRTGCEFRTLAYAIVVFGET